MAPDVLRRTPHDAGVLDRTGIVAASAPSVAEEQEIPTDAYRPRSRRFQFTALASLGLMLAVVVTGVRGHGGEPSDVAPTTAGGRGLGDTVPVVSAPEESRAPHGDERETGERTPSVPASRTPSDPEPGPTVEPTVRRVHPSIVLPTPGQRPEPGAVPGADEEMPVSVEVPHAGDAGDDAPGPDRLPWSAVLTPHRDDDRLRARDDVPTATEASDVDRERRGSERITPSPGG
ncbi:hypothetical protein [Saccharomonospora azurea]|uniref:hypothetical protein n=1 Tax=Saccharomonospora azurea TaxID=40988 RepID=UPI0024099A68|nr:hypothetical protein [Saccharomonospora azurea]